MPRSTTPLTLSEDQQSQIEQWLAAMGTPQQVALRCRIVLASARGDSEAAIASELQINRKTVRLWRERFQHGGSKGLWEIAVTRANVGALAFWRRVAAQMAAGEVDEQWLDDNRWNGAILRFEREGSRVQGKPQRGSGEHQDQGSAV